MKRSLILLSCPVALAAVLLTLSPAFGAGPWYLGGGVGYTRAMDSDTVIGGEPLGKVKSDGGFSVGLFGGYKMEAFRFEGEFSYRANDANEVDPATPAPQFKLDGDTTVLALMVNAYYDIKTGSAFTPFLGAGVGCNQMTLDVSPAGLPTEGVDDDDMVFAYQFIAGVGYAINPKMTLDLAYRYSATADPSFTSKTGDPVDIEVLGHGIGIGLRYAF